MVRDKESEIFFLFNIIKIGLQFILLDLEEDVSEQFQDS